MEKKQSKSQLSRTTRGILFDIKQELASYNIHLPSLVGNIFKNPKYHQFRQSEFQLLIKEINYHFDFKDINLVWDELNPTGKKHLDAQILYGTLEEINETDDPWNGLLETQSLEIMNSMGNIEVLPEQDRITLALKDLKDIFKEHSPWEIMDVFDEDRDGKLDKVEMQKLLNFFEFTASNQLLIIKGIFDNQNKCSFHDIMKRLGLENIRQNVQFDELPNRNIGEIVDLKGSIDMKKKHETKQPEKKQETIKEVIITKIPPSLQPYYTGLTEMTEPFLSTARAKIEANQIFADKENPETKFKKYEHITNILKQQYYLFQQAQSVIQRSQMRTGLGELINANQINQGSVGNCYFMSAIASMAEFYPQLIYKLFVLEKNPGSIYGIRLFVDGKWETITLDARFPVDEYGRLAYGKPKYQEIWSLLLEKAWAKLYKSYENISSGSSSEGLSAITGAPIITLQKKQPELIEKIKEYLAQRYVINISGSAYLDKQTGEWQEQFGLFAGHAYSIINLHLDLPWKNEKISLIKLRNPWGSKAWKQRWSFKSSEWTPELRNRLNYHKDPNDGTFYMSVNDFQICFDQPSICQVHPQYVNSTITLTPGTHSVSIEFKITAKNRYFFSMYQDSKRKYKLSGNYELSKCWLFLARRKENGGIVPVASKACIRSNLHVEATLEPGAYVISCKVEWNYDTKLSFNLTSYGPQPITFKQTQKDKEFLANFILQRAKDTFEQEQKKPYSAPLQKCFRIIKTSHEQGYGYIMIQNLSDIKLSSKLSFSKNDTSIETPIGLKPLKPDTLDFQLEVSPGQKVIKGLLVDPQGINYQMEETISYTQVRNV